MLGIMKVTRTMRDGPNGQPIEDSFASLGEQVDILETRDSWAHVKLVNVPGQPNGWVSADAIDTSAAISGGPLDKGAFARECWRDCLDISNPHYVAAVAELRSRVRDDSDNGNIGPFRFTQEEWNANLKVIDVFEFQPDQIGDWRRQCTVFAVMVRGTSTNLAAKLAQSSPTAAQLYLAQMIGVEAAVNTLTNPATNITAAIGSTAPDLFERYGALLKDATGAPGTGDMVLGSIRKALGDALDTMRPFVIQAGSDLLDDTNTRTDILHGPDAPPASQAVGPTTGTFQQIAPTVMKKLMDDFGFTKEQTAGILGNLGEESGGFKEIQEINPIHGGKGGLGWAQWTGERRTKFESFCQQKGVQPSSFEGNYGFLKLELSSKPFNRAVTAVKQTTTVPESVRRFEATFEMADPDFVHFEMRDKFAQIALAAFDKLGAG